MSVVIIEGTAELYLLINLSTPVLFLDKGHVVFPPSPHNNTCAHAQA